MTPEQRISALEKEVADLKLLLEDRLDIEKFNSDLQAAMDKFQETTLRAVVDSIFEQLRDRIRSLQ